MRIHELKTWADMFWAVKCGDKTAEFRKNDRDYKVGDFLLLKEYSPMTKEYSGNELLVKVTHIIEGGAFGVPDDYCVMSIRVGKVICKRVGIF